jgi:hypothetical protein
MCVSTRVCVCQHVYVCVLERESTEALVELREKPGIIQQRANVVRHLYRLFIYFFNLIFFV